MSAALAGSQPAAAQVYPDEQPCPLGTVGNPAYGCTMPGGDFWPYYYSNGYSGYLPYGTYGVGFAHAGGFGHGVGGDPGIGFAQAGGGGFHGMGGGFGHGGGGGHR